MVTRLGKRRQAAGICAYETIERAIRMAKVNGWQARDQAARKRLLAAAFI
jgi:hypothetical protein